MADTDTTWQYSEHMHADVTQTIVSRALPYSPVGITRVNTNRRHSGLTDPYERESAYLVILQLQPFGEQELWLAGKPAPHVPYGAGWLAIYDLERNWSANLIGEYDCMQFYIPQAALTETAKDLGIRAVQHLHCPPHLAVADPVVHHLSLALLPALAHPEHASALFVDHMALALRAHLVQHYSGVQVPSRRVQAGLAPWQEERAKALIMAHLDGEVLLETLAEACGVSRAHFAKAFRTSVGMPPHRWMVLQRIERAQHYLHHTQLPLGEIAQLCGFADQSHFTRTFGRVVGANPREWRRQKRH
ncbi:AraC family transcriptional regulator [Cupriavidus sp. 2SB]|uniref:AraC family transcriptional regulator n=1 Tax=Cupriavidus sp. 2SB TaxID=2502199 RepID=UPI0010F5BC87|nr:AraC family transcriptional regulator [Cupriavidus sp. 2SB]